jgi:ubiquitin carboxyl-terminal hydrolase 34
VHKRVLLDKLPNHLTLNLQRIVFDLDTFVNRKIHSRLEFPEVLNLTAFTKQTIDEAKNRKPTQMEDEEQQRRHENHSTTESHLYQYRLTGIVVHLGAAEAGHYYSLIRSNDKWIVFDDSRISQFEDTIENECYGGASVSSDDWNKEVDYSKNAYVLMYERVHKQKIVLESVGEQEL